jgi:hypothetical protein
MKMPSRIAKECNRMKTDGPISPENCEVRCKCGDHHQMPMMGMRGQQVGKWPERSVLRTDDQILTGGANSCPSESRPGIQPAIDKTRVWNIRRFLDLFLFSGFKRLNSSNSLENAKIILWLTKYRCTFPGDLCQNV